MPPHASSQAAAEYVALTTQNALRGLSGLADDVWRFADRYPLVAGVAVAIFVLIFWATRARTR